MHTTHRTRHHRRAGVGVLLPVLVALAGCSGSTNADDTPDGDTASTTTSARTDTALGTSEGPSDEEQQAFAEAEQNYREYQRLYPKDSRDPFPSAMDDLISQNHLASTGQEARDEFYADGSYFVGTTTVEWVEPVSYRPKTDPPSLKLHACTKSVATLYDSDGKVSSLRVTPEGEPLEPDEPSFTEYDAFFWDDGDGWKYATAADQMGVDSCDK